jgi:hypothetical protein
VKIKKKLIVPSALGAFVLLLLVFVYYAFLSQSISVVNMFSKPPKTIANNNEPSKITNTKKQLDPRVGNTERQIFLSEEENPKEIPTFDSPNENSQEENNSEIVLEYGNKLESDNNNPDPLEDHYDLQANKAMLLQQLEELLTNRDYSEQLVNILNQLAWLGDSDALAALIDGYQKTKYDGDASGAILDAISKVANPEAVHDLGDYLNNAIDDADDTLLVSVSKALSNIGSEEATDLLIYTLSTTSETDNTNLIMSKAIANIRNTDVAPILVNMIEKKANGYGGAMEALLKLGDFGTEKITNLLTQDENIEYREKLLSVTETMQFDEETYYAINKLAELNEDFEDFFRDAGNNLSKNDENGEYRFKE